MKPFRFLFRLLRRVFWPLATVVAIGALVFGGVYVGVMRGFSGTAHVPADCAIVFGAAAHVRRDSSGSPIGEKAGPGIARRMATAVALYHRKQVKHLFLSGGKGTTAQLSEAEIMQEYALNQRVPPSAITLEDQSRSTWENLVFTRPLTKDCASVIGISDRYHLTRIQLLAAWQGWVLPTYPASTNAGRAFEFESSMREAAAILWYRLFSVLHD